MEQLPLVPMDVPVTYRICILGGLESDYAQRLWGMTSTTVKLADETQQTELVGKVADQAVLVGIINALYNTGHTVVSVERFLSETDPNANEALPPDNVNKED